MSDQSPDLSTLLAACEKALQVAVFHARDQETAEAAVTIRNTFPHLRDEIVRLRSLIARTVVVMDGSWDMLPPGEAEALTRELRAVALTDAPAPQETTE